MSSAWVMLAFLSAFSLATSDALTKKALAGRNEYLVAWFRLFFALPFLIASWFFIPLPELDIIFFLAFCLALPIELVTIVLYIKALKASPLSLTLPFLALTPVFLIGVPYLILGEKVSVPGGTGILLIAAGSYLLNINEIRRGILEPIKAIVKEKGSVMMICVAILYSITSTLGKMAIEHSSPLFFGITYFIVLTVCFTPIVLWAGRDELHSFVARREYTSLIIPGFFYALMIASHMIAINLTKVAYMISVKRSSLLVGVIYGFILFREKNIKERTLGAFLMFVGFVLVVTAR
jgi:drug/metabolite transporter (DMT)-like permease